MPKEDLLCSRCGCWYSAIFFRAGAPCGDLSATGLEGPPCDGRLMTPRQLANEAWRRLLAGARVVIREDAIYVSPIPEKHRPPHSRRTPC